MQFRICKVRMTFVMKCIESIIGGVDYNQNKVNQWTASIVEHSLTQLVKQGKPFKYIVNCAVMQKSGAGLHTANSCYWDTTTDGKTLLLIQIGIDFVDTVFALTLLGCLFRE
ncbi:UNVERIFIED_CONTAM: hypothetical protein FKN15_057818 [Acipenser sinensis]